MTTRYAPTLFETTEQAQGGFGLQRVLGFWRLYLGSIGTAARQFREFERLNAMSDEELLEAGITRDRILDHVMHGDETPR